MYLSEKYYCIFLIKEINNEKTNHYLIKASFLYYRFRCILYDSIKKNLESIEPDLSWQDPKQA